MRQASQPVVAVVADIVASRRLSDRADYQRRLQAGLGALTTQAAGRLLSPWTLTLGDECQALYAGFAGLFADLFALLDLCRPAELRIALGVGTLSTDLNPQRAIGMDGPAFHRARQMLEDLKRRPRSAIGIEAGPADSLELANACLGLLAAESRSWKANTRAIFGGLLRGDPPEHLATLTGLGLRAVYKNAAGRLLPERRRLLEALATELDGRLARGELT
jgi:hypothetical protein